MVRLCGILFSRWTQGALLMLVVVTALLHNRTFWIVTASVIGIALAAMLLVFMTVMRDARRSWCRFPDTPQYREYARKREAQQSHEENKNKITLK